MRSLLGLIFTFISGLRLWPWFLEKKMLPIRWPKKKINADYVWKDIIKTVTEYLDDNQSAVLVFTAYDSGSLVSNLIRIVTKDSWSHAGIFDMGSPWWTLEMRGGGFESRHIRNAIETYTSFAIGAFLIRGLEEYGECDRRIKEIEFLGPDYDAKADFLDKDQLNCSELVYRVFSDLTDQMSKTKFEFGRPIYSPGQVYDDMYKIIEFKDGKWIYY